MKKAQEAPVEERAIPTPPSGGSWTFDRTKWEWVSTDPVEQPAEEIKE